MMRVEELYWIEPWCWCRDGFYGDFYYNEQSRFGIGLGTCRSHARGKRTASAARICRVRTLLFAKVNAPLYEIALIAFADWSPWRAEDWAAFVGN